MNPLVNLAIWGIIASIVSVILGAFAIAIAVYFFVVGRNAEKNVATSLIKIETQAELLQKITAKQVDRLTKYVTAEKPGERYEQFTELLQVLIKLPQTMTGGLTADATGKDQEKLIDELLICYIAMYFYVAQTNIWAQIMLPNPQDFDENNTLNSTTKRIVDLSCADFTIMAQILAACDFERLKKTPVAHLMEETMTTWRAMVRTTADVFVLRTKSSEE